MTATELVETCWGKPRRIVKKTTETGVREDYIYNLGHIVELRAGKVTAILETR